MTPYSMHGHFFMIFNSFITDVVVVVAAAAARPHGHANALPGIPALRSFKGKENQGLTCKRCARRAAHRERVRIMLYRSFRKGAAYADEPDTHQA